MLSIFTRLMAFLLGKRVVVQGWSMHPTLAPEERVLFDRLAYRREKPQRGDIVLVRHPQRPDMLLIKRIASVPGITASGNEGTLGADEYFLLGDQLDHSTDSRHFGPVSRGQILGRAALVYWPPGRFRYLQNESRNDSNGLKNNLT